MSSRREIRLITGRPLRLCFRRSQRARRLSIHASARAGIEVVLPRRATEAEAEALLVAKAAWVARQADHYDVWDGPRQRVWGTDSELSVLGRPRRLDLVALPHGRSRPRARLDDTSLQLELPAEQILDPRPALERWLRRFAGTHLRARTEELGRPRGLVPERVIVGERTSRWGSCSWRGTISYCYRLVMAPAVVVDAVVIHELCHLRHANHGRRFRALVRQHCPDHDRHMAWLRAHGTELEL